MNMIEKVAESQANFDGRKLINMPAGERERYRQRARLAIEAMREPTSTMCLGGKEYRNEWPIWDDRTSPVIIWRGMITAALNERKEGAK